MATLGTVFAGSAYALSGKEKAQEQGPPINAQSTEEEQFIQFVTLVAYRSRLLLTSAVQRIYKERQRRGAEGQALESG